MKKEFQDLRQGSMSMNEYNTKFTHVSLRSHVSQLVVDSMPFELWEEFNKFNLRIVANTEAIKMEVGSILLQEIQKGQVEDEKIQEIKHNIKEEKSPCFSEDEDGVLWYKGRICVPNVKELKDKILREANECNSHFLQ
jgi:hypothetical protein